MIQSPKSHQTSEGFQSPKIYPDTLRESQESEQCPFQRFQTQRTQQAELSQLSSAQFQFTFDKTLEKISKNENETLLRLKNNLKNFLEYSVNACCKFFIQFKLYHPQQKIKWDCIQILAIFVFGNVIIPLYMAFGERFNFLWAINICLVIFIFDIGVKINSSFYEFGKIIEDRRQIFNNYIRNYFLIDIGAILAVIYLNYSQSYIEEEIKKSDAILILFYPKFLQFSIMKKKFYEQYNQQKTTRYYFKLLEAILSVIIFSNFSSCLWIFIAKYEKYLDRPTLFDSKLEDIQALDDPKSQYLLSFYFSIVTMVSVGYGDITPLSELEYFVGIFFVIISCVMFAFTISQVQSIVYGIDEIQNKKDNLIIPLNNYLKKNKISQNLQYSIREYIEFYYKESLDDFYDTEQKIFSILSENLKQKLLIESYRVALKDSPIFQKNFSESLIEKTVQLVQVIYLNPEQIIFQDNDESNDIYFVDKGQLEIYIHNKKNQNETNILHLVKQGSVVGQVEFFTGQRRYFSIRSDNFSTLFKIDRTQFLRILQENEEDYEKFCHIRDSLIFNKRDTESISQIQRKIDLQCYGCHGIDHFFQYCPKLSYQVDYIRQAHLFHEEQNQKQERHSNCQYAKLAQQTRSVNKQNCLSLIDIVVQQCYKYYQQNQEYLDMLIYTPDDDQFLMEDLELNVELDENQGESYIKKSTDGKNDRKVNFKSSLSPGLKPQNQKNRLEIDVNPPEFKLNMNQDSSDSDSNEEKKNNDNEDSNQEQESCENLYDSLQNDIFQNQKIGQMKNSIVMMDDQMISSSKMKHSGTGSILQVMLNIYLQGVRKDNPSLTNLSLSQLSEQKDSSNKQNLLNLQRNLAPDIQHQTIYEIEHSHMSQSSSSQFSQGNSISQTNQSETPKDTSTTPISNTPNQKNQNLFPTFDKIPDQNQIVQSSDKKKENNGIDKPTTLKVIQDLPPIKKQPKSILKSIQNKKDENQEQQSQKSSDNQNQTLKQPEQQQNRKQSLWKQKVSLTSITDGSQKRMSSAKAKLDSIKAFQQEGQKKEKKNKGLHLQIQKQQEELQKIKRLSQNTSQLQNMYGGMQSFFMQPGAFYGNPLLANRKKFIPSVAQNQARVGIDQFLQFKKKSNKDMDSVKRFQSILQIGDSGINNHNKESNFLSTLRESIEQISQDNDEELLFDLKRDYDFYFPQFNIMNILVKFNAKYHDRYIINLKKKSKKVKANVMLASQFQKQVSKRSPSMNASSMVAFQRKSTKIQQSPSRSQEQKFFEDQSQITSLLRVKIKSLAVFSNKNI